MCSSLHALLLYIMAETAYKVGVCLFISVHLLVKIAPSSRSILEIAYSIKI